MLIILATACLVNQALYEELKAGLEDDDGDGYSEHDGDCNDNNSAVSPGLSEKCDSLDNDCDGGVDNVIAPFWYLDADGDGYGDDATALATCSPTTGAVAVGTDCNDNDVAVSIVASEICDGQDNDCDGDVDEASAINADDWYVDGDGDGFGVDDGAVAACDQPAGYASAGGDCDDAHVTAFPGAVEVCDDANIDEDCSGAADDDDAGTTGQTTWYIDYDSDGYGTDAYTVEKCDEPSGYVANLDDCADTQADAHPGGVEVCGTGIDEDCDGTSNFCGLIGDYGLGGAPLALTGTTDGDNFGFSVGSLSDVDGDGLGDIVATAHGSDLGGSRSGSIYLISPALPTLPAALLTLTGEAANDRAGEDIAGGGDADGDGIFDLLIGAPGSDRGYSEAGRLYLVSGTQRGGVSLAEADRSFGGLHAADAVGSSVAFVGDADGDGLDAFATTSYANDDRAIDAGIVYVVQYDADTFADASSALTGVAAGDGVVRVAGGEDLDGDGLDDLAVGAPGVDGTGTSRGAAYVVFAPYPASGDLSVADGRRIGNEDGDYAGYNIALSPDMNGDGLADLLVSALLADEGAVDGGTVYVVHGPATGERELSTADAVFYAESAGDQAGWSLAAVGDVDGNGEGDVLLGALTSDLGGADSGAAYLLLSPLAGRQSLSVASARFIGDAADDDAGIDVSGAGDVDADGYADFLIGARGNDDGANAAGSAYLYFGTGI